MVVVPERRILAQMRHDGVDVYPDFPTMCESEKGNYELVVVEKPSPVVVLSIHGGCMEQGASRLARAIARDGGVEDFSLVDLRGLRSGGAGGNHRLHITATRFAEPKVDRLLEKSAVAVSIHGDNGTEGDRIYVGGRNERMVEAVERTYRRIGLGDVLAKPYPHVRGTAKRNVVNRPPYHGVQITFAPRILTGVSEGELLKITLATREAVVGYARRL